MSAIASFYKDKTVLITGATGCLGKLTTEQLLRKCEPKKLYLLVRNKTNIKSEIRVQKLIEGIVFNRLRTEKSNFSDKIEVIPGDLTEKDLGLTQALREKIIEEVEIVIHSAANLNFIEHLRAATNANLKGTISMIKLCQQIKNLESFLYISTAFSNCPYAEIKEEFYDYPFGCDNLINLVDKLNDDELTAKTPEIIGKWPNTYAFSKAAAENALKLYASNLPVSIFRPVIVAGTLSEPIPGWIDNFHGPSGLIAGLSTGVVKLMQCDPDGPAEIVPCDMVAAASLAITYARTLSQLPNEKFIYNFVSEPDKKITYGNFGRIMKAYTEAIPPKNLLLTPTYYLVKNPLIFTLKSLIYNSLPTLIFFIYFIIIAKNFRAFSKYLKGFKLANALKYYMIRKWNFETDNTKNLWNNLKDEDKILFNFNINSIDWPDYLKICYSGVKQHLLKENSDNLSKAIVKYKRIKMIENVVIKLIFWILMWFLLWYGLTLCSSFEFDCRLYNFIIFLLFIFNL